MRNVTAAEFTRVRLRKWFLHAPPYVTRPDLHNGACRRLLYLNNGSCTEQRFEIRFRVYRGYADRLPRAFVTFFAISLLMKFALDYNDNIKKTIYHRLTVTISTN